MMIFFSLYVLGGLLKKITKIWRSPILTRHNLVKKLHIIVYAVVELSTTIWYQFSF